jgi:hypothetical protein
VPSERIWKAEVGPCRGLLRWVGEGGSHGGSKSQLAGDRGLLFIQGKKGELGWIRREIQRRRDVSEIGPA